MWRAAGRWVVVVVVVVVLPFTATMAHPEDLWGARTPSHAPVPPLTVWEGHNDPQARIIRDDAPPHGHNMMSVGWAGAGGGGSPLPPPPPALQLPQWVPDYKPVKDTYWDTILDALQAAGHSRMPPSSQLTVYPLHPQPSPDPPRSPSQPLDRPTSSLQTPWRPLITTHAPITPAKVTPRPGHIHNLVLDVLASGASTPPSRELVKELLEATNFNLLKHLKEQPPTGASQQVSGPEGDDTRRRKDGHLTQDTFYLPWPNVEKDSQWTSRRDTEVGEDAPTEELPHSSTWWWGRKDKQEMDSLEALRTAPSEPLQVTMKTSTWRPSLSSVWQQAPVEGEGQHTASTTSHHHQTGHTKSITALSHPPTGSLRPSHSLQDLAAPDALHPPSGPEEEEGYTHAWLHAVVQNDLKNWGYPYDPSALQHLPPGYGFPWPPREDPNRRHHKTTKTKTGSSGGARHGHRLDVSQKPRQEPQSPIRNTRVAASKPGHLTNLSLFQQSVGRPFTSLPNPTRGPDREVPLQVVTRPGGASNILGQSSTLYPSTIPLRKDNVMPPLQVLHHNLNAPLNPHERQTTPNHRPLPHTWLHPPPEVQQVSQESAPEPRVLGGRFGFGPPKGDDVIAKNEDSPATAGVLLSDHAVQDLVQEAPTSPPKTAPPAVFLRKPQPHTTTSTAPHPPRDTRSHTPSPMFKFFRPFKYTTKPPSTTTTTTTSYTTPRPTTTTTEAANTTTPKYIPWPNPTPGAGPFPSHLPRLPFFDRPIRRPSLPTLNFLNPFNLFRSRENTKPADNTFPSIFPFSSFSPSLSSSSFSSYPTDDSEPSPSLPAIKRKVPPSGHLTSPSVAATQTYHHTKPRVHPTKSTLIKLPRGLSPSARPTIQADPHSKPHLELFRATRSPARHNTQASPQQHWQAIKNNNSNPPIPHTSIQPPTQASWVPITTQKPPCETPMTWPPTGTLTPQTKPSGGPVSPLQGVKRSPKNAHLHIVRGVPLTVLKGVSQGDTHHHTPQGQQEPSTNPQKQNINPQHNTAQSTLPPFNLIPPPLMPQTSELHHHVQPPPPGTPVNLDFPMPELIKFTIEDVIRPSHSRPQPQTRQQTLDTSARPRDLSLASSEQVVTVAKFPATTTKEPKVVTEMVTVRSSERTSTPVSGQTETSSNTTESPSPQTTPVFTTMSMVASSRMAPLFTTSPLFQDESRVSSPLQSSPLTTTTTKPTTNHSFLFPSNWKFAQSPSPPPQKLKQEEHENRPRKGMRNEGESQQEKDEDRHGRIRGSFSSPTSHTTIVEATPMPKKGETFPRVKHFRTSSSSSSFKRPKSSPTPIPSPPLPTTRTRGSNTKNWSKGVLVASHSSSPPSPAKTRNIPPGLLKREEVVMMAGKHNHRVIQKPPQIQSRPKTVHRVPQNPPPKQLKLRYTTQPWVTDQTDRTTTPFALGRSTVVTLPVEKTVVDKSNSSPATSIRERHAGHPVHPFTTTSISSTIEKEGGSPFTTISFSPPIKAHTRRSFTTTVLSAPHDKRAGRITVTTTLPSIKQNHTRQGPEDVTKNRDEFKRVDFTLNLSSEKEKDEVEEGIRNGDEREKEEDSKEEEVKEGEMWSEEMKGNTSTPVIIKSLQTTTTTTTTTARPRLSSIQRIREFMARKRERMRSTTTTTTATPTPILTTTTTTTTDPPQDSTITQSNARRFPGLSIRSFTSYRKQLTDRRKTSTAPPTTGPLTTSSTTTTTRRPQQSITRSRPNTPTTQDSIHESSEILQAERRAIQDHTGLMDLLSWESTRLRPTKGTDTKDDFTPEGTSMSFMAVVPPDWVEDAPVPRMVRGMGGGVQVSPTYASIGWSRSHKAMDSDNTHK